MNSGNQRRNVWLTTQDHHQKLIIIIIAIWQIDANGHILMAYNVWLTLILLINYWLCWVN